MKKYLVELYFSGVAKGFVHANSEEEAKALFEYAWNTEDCDCEFHETFAGECKEATPEMPSFPVLDCEWCREGVLEELEQEG